MIIEIENLSKSFKDVKAVNGLTFGVREGELFAFLGINGAGKSTTINIISGILSKDEGTVKVCGEDIDGDVDSIKSKIGIVFQTSALDKRLSVYDNLKSRAALYGIGGKKFSERIEYLDGLLGVKEILKRPLNKLSGGQKRRVDIARALIHCPKLLILDEPTTGLDPKTRMAVWESLEKLRKEQGLTILLTTHYMEEAAVADYVVIIDGGKKVAEGTPHDLKTKYASDYLRIYNNTDVAAQVLCDCGYNIRRGHDYIEAEIKGTAEVKKFITEHPQIFEDFEVLKGNMDDVFLKVTGKDITAV